MNTFDIVCLYEGEKFSVCIDSSLCTEADVLEYLREQKVERFEQESGEDAPDPSSLSDEFEVSDWGDVPDWAQDWDVLEELIPVYENSYYDIEVFEAAHECSVQFSDVDECYSGEWDSDEEMVEELLESCGDIPSNLPSYVYIDWERTARDIMYDYCEHNHHYFRNI